MTKTPTKTELTARAALRLRVWGRRSGYMTADMAWDAIAEVQGPITSPPALSAQAVIRTAQRELAANGEWIPVR